MADDTPPPEVEALRERLATLEPEVLHLRERVARLGVGNENLLRLAEGIVAERDCAEGKMQRTRWRRTERGYQWDDHDPCEEIIGVHRGYLVGRRDGSKRWVEPSVEIVLFPEDGHPMKHLPLRRFPTMLAAVEAAEAWMDSPDHDWTPEGNHHRCARCNEWHSATPGLETPHGRDNWRTCNAVMAERTRAGGRPGDERPCLKCGRAFAKHDDDTCADGWSPDPATRVDT